MRRCGPAPGPRSGRGLARPARLGAASDSLGQRHRVSVMTSFWVAGAAASSDDVVAIRNPLDGTVVGETGNATPAQVEEAVAAAAAVAREAAGLPASARAA